MDLLNVGCGRHFHAAWTNVDLVATAPEVLEHDLRVGLPFSDATFDAVYHSHVVEHLEPQEAEVLISECCRVLRPGGTIRVAVPDLEMIARCYLRALQRVDQGAPQGWDDHAWMTLELLDQMVRRQPGGRMAQFVRRPELANKAFIRSRMGEELFPTASHGSSAAQAGPRAKSPLPQRRRVAELLRARLGALRWKLALAVVRLLMGSRGDSALREGMFRQSGEVHRWMYDRVSLRRLLERSGFIHVAVCRGEESRIPQFSQYGLDVVETGVRKPDSLFMEGTKPATSQRATADGLEAGYGGTATAVRGKRPEPHSQTNRTAA